MEREIGGTYGRFVHAIVIISIISIVIIDIITSVIISIMI